MPDTSRVEDGSPCRNISKTCGRNSGEMPRPVSLILIATSRSSRSMRIEIEPRAGVNFTALESKFQNTWRSRFGSAVIAMPSSAETVSTRRSFAAISGATIPPLPA